MDFEGNQDEWVKPVWCKRGKQENKRVLLFVCEAERNGWKGEEKTNRWREQRRRDIGVETRMDGLERE